MDTNKSPANATMCTMAQLFGYRYHPVIPDMQRDYCWGLEKTDSPVEQRKCAVFVDGLIRLFNMPARKKRQMSIGLLYGYEYPNGSGALNIIDGQQRLTTLYLLLGMVYRRIPETEAGSALRKYLVKENSDGDAAPKLQYQSKSEAMYFLTDLVSKFFLSRSGRLSQIEQSKWYFKSYDADTNARSFLGAIRSIDASIEKELADNPDFDMEGFSRFLVDDVVFRYFDMGSRSVAERMFITINTTGHPLTLAQNLRALAFGFAGPQEEIFLAEFWNEMEDWFWRHRPMSMDAFLRLAIKLGPLEKTKDDDAVQFLRHDLSRIFDAYSRCVGIGVDMTNEFAAIPMLRYALRFGERAGDCDIERLGHMLCNYTRYQKTGSADRQQALDLVMRMPGPNLQSALSVRHLSAKILNDEERAKLELLAENDFDPYLQRLIRRGEEHPMLRGRVGKVLSWCYVKDADNHGESAFSIDRLAHYIDSFYEIWGAEIDRRDDLDLVRRALLCVSHKAYPIVRRGDMVLSLCWKDYDWQRLMTDAPGLVRQLIDRTDSFSLEEIVDRYADASNPYYFIIKSAHVLDGCRKRQLLRPCAPFIGIYYLHNSRTQWWLEGRKLHIDSEKWNYPRAHGQTSLQIDSIDFNLAISLKYTPDGHSRYKIELFQKPDSQKEKLNLRIIAEELPPGMRYDRAGHSCYIQCQDAHQAIKQLGWILENA